MGTYNQLTISPRKLFSDTQETLPVTQGGETPVIPNGNQSVTAKPSVVDFNISFDTYQTQGSQVLPVRTEELPLIPPKKKKREPEAPLGATKLKATPKAMRTRPPRKPKNIGQTPKQLKTKKTPKPMKSRAKASIPKASAPQGEVIERRIDARDPNPISYFMYVRNSFLLDCERY